MTAPGWLSIDRQHNGSYAACAEVRNVAGDVWFETQVYYGYPKAQIPALFRQHLADSGLVVEEAR